MINLLAHHWRFNGTHLINMKYQNITSLLDDVWTKIPDSGQSGQIVRQGVEDPNGKRLFKRA